MFEDVTQQFSLVYPTLIAKFLIPDCQSVNSELLQLSLDHERSGNSKNYANVGGWHSSDNLLEWTGDAVAKLKQWITEALTRTVRASSQLPEAQSTAAPKGSFRISAWANLIRKGDYHRLHNHPGSAWSGVYYVAVAPQDQSLNGVLEFYDPRPFAEMVDTPYSPYGQRMIIRPQAGLMVLFPSWLYHSVLPSDTDDIRLSVAFNAAWISG